MPFIRRVILFTIYCLTTSNAFAIVNLDSLHFEKNSLGISGEFSLGVSGATGNTDKSQINIDTQIKATAEHYSNVILTNYQRGESNDTLDTNKRFIHLRHINTGFDPELAWEVYFQSETDQFTRLSLRTLLGTGVRYSLNQNTLTRHFLGAGGYYSRETLEKAINLSDDGTSSSTRVNLYLLSRIALSDNATLYNTLYYQPDVESFSDFRAFNVFTLKVNIVKSLSLKMSVKITHDSEPPATIDKTDTSYTTVFNYSF